MIKEKLKKLKNTKKMPTEDFARPGGERGVRFLSLGGNRDNHAPNSYDWQVINTCRHKHGGGNGDDAVHMMNLKDYICSLKKSSDGIQLFV